jgi:hypothetical protein
MLMSMYSRFLYSIGLTAVLTYLLDTTELALDLSVS